MRSAGSRCAASMLPLWFCAACAQPITVTIPEAATLPELAQAVFAAGLCSSDDVLAFAADEARVRALGAGPGLVGYVAPGSYTVERSHGLATLLFAAVQAQLAVMAEARAGSSVVLDDAALLARACWVEREAKVAGRFVLVASVLHNRLAKGFAPQTGTLSAVPECAPRKAAIEAVLRPAGDELFYFHDADGTPAIALSDEERAGLAAIEPDPAPPSITRGIHYYRSNEKRPHHFRAPALGRGGVLIGVGSEQNYTLAGWARPDILVLMDFDIMIAFAHGAYRASFDLANTPQELVTLWNTGSGLRSIEKRINELYTDQTERAGVLSAFLHGRGHIANELNDLVKYYAEHQVTSYVTDLEEFLFVKALYRHDRVLRIRGDLTAKKTLRQLGALFARLKRPVRILYMSNAEEYFPFGPDYRENINSLPTDERSVILRTVRASWDYAYMVQTFDNFRSWLALPEVLTTDAFIPTRPNRRSIVYLELGGQPETQPAAPTIEPFDG